MPQQEAFDVDSYDHLPSEIPSKLLDRITGVYAELRLAQVQKKADGSWRTLRKRLRFGPDGPQEPPDSIAHQLCELASEDVVITGKDGDYRAFLTYSDTEAPNGSRRAFCLIRAKMNADGGVDLTDGSDMPEREQLTVLQNHIDKQAEQLDAMHQRYMDMLDKNITLCETMGNQAVNYAAGTADTARGLSDVTKAAVNTMKGAADIVRDHQKEATAVQLAKLDQQGDAQKLKIVMMLVQKFGGPLFAQITNVIAGKNKNAPQLPKGSEEPVEPEVLTEDQPMNERLAGWLSRLGDARVTKLREIVGDHVEKFLEAKTTELAESALAGLKKEFDGLQNSEEGQEKLGIKLTQLGELLGDDLTQEFVTMLPD
jgi:hypothetical protein